MTIPNIEDITEEDRRKFFGLKEGEGDDDPFYSKENLVHLIKSIEQFKRGQVVTVTFEELSDILNEDNDNKRATLIKAINKR